MTDLLSSISIISRLTNDNITIYYSDKKLHESMSEFDLMFFTLYSLERDVRFKDESKKLRFKVSDFRDCFLKWALLCWENESLVKCFFTINYLVKKMNQINKRLEFKEYVPFCYFKKVYEGCYEFLKSMDVKYTIEDHSRMLKDYIRENVIVEDPVFDMRGKLFIYNVNRGGGFLAVETGQELSYDDMLGGFLSLELRGSDIMSQLPLDHVKRMVFLDQHIQCYQKPVFGNVPWKRKDDKGLNSITVCVKEKHGVVGEMLRFDMPGMNLDLKTVEFDLKPKVINTDMVTLMVRGEDEFCLTSYTKVLLLKFSERMKGKIVPDFQTKSHNLVKDLDVTYVVKPDTVLLTYYFENEKVKIPLFTVYKGVVIVNKDIFLSYEIQSLDLRQVKLNGDVIVLDYKYVNRLGLRLSGMVGHTFVDLCELYNSKRDVLNVLKLDGLCYGCYKGRFYFVYKLESHEVDLDVFRVSSSWYVENEETWKPKRSKKGGTIPTVGKEAGHIVLTSISSLDVIRDEINRVSVLGKKMLQDGARSGDILFKNLLYNVVRGTKFAVYFSMVESNNNMARVYNGIVEKNVSLSEHTKGTVIEYVYNSADQYEKIILLVMLLYGLKSGY
jgi:hypothetical protein